MIYAWIGIFIVSAGMGFYAGLRVGQADTQGWIEQAAAMEAQLHQLQTDGDDRAKRAETAAAKATAELAKVRKQAEVDRAKWLNEAVAGWGAYIDGQRVPVPADADFATAIAACRADASAARGALAVVLERAFAIREIAHLNTEQLKQLQDWVREVTR